MKRFLVILAALVVISTLVLSGCSTASPTPAATTKAPATSAAPAPATSAAPAPASSAAPKPSTSAPPSSAPASTAAPAAGVKKIKFSYTMPKGASIGAGFEWFATEFPKRTNGRYTVETYPSNTLVPVTGALDAIKSGTCELIGTSTGTFPKNFPLTLVAAIPTLGFPGGVDASYAEGSKALWDLYNAVPDIQNEFKGVTPIWLMCLDPYNLVSKKKEIHAPADFKGLKVGGSGAKMDMVSASGGVPVEMQPPQSPDMLQKATVEAAFLTFSQVNDYKIFEVCDYFYRQDFGCGTYIILMNTNFFSSMSKEDQKILSDTWVEANMVGGKSSMEGVLKGIQVTKDAKKTVAVATAAESAAWEKAADVAIEKWKADAKAVGMTDAVLSNVIAKWKEVRAAHLVNVK